MSNSLTLRITDAGRAAMVNAENTGTDPLTITHIAIGSGLYETTDNQTELQTEIKRLTTFGGQAVAADTVHVTVLDESTDAYSLGEFGLITDAGVLFAVYSGEVAPILEKAASGMMVLSVDAVITSVNVQNLSFSGTGFMLPPGTETVPGILRLADNTEALQGTDDQKAMTAKKTKAVIDQHKTEHDAHTWGQIAEKPVVVSQAHAEAGTVTTERRWTPQRVRQAILGWWNNSSAKTKLDGIATGATANATDAQLRARSSHTGTQAISTVSGLQSALDSKLNSNHSSVTNSREWTASTVSQSEAEAGTSSTRRAWTAQRVRQAIVGWWNGVTSSWGRSFVTSSNAESARASLNLGSMATRNTGTGGSEHRTNAQNDLRYLLRSDNGVFKQLPGLVAENLDNRIDAGNGVASMASQANATLGNNFPWGGAGGTLLNFAQGSYGTQIYNTRSGGGIFWRVKRNSNGDMSEWKRFWDSETLQFSLSGTTLTITDNS